MLIIFWTFVLILCLNPVKHDSWNNKKIYITLAFPVFFYILFCVSFLLFVTTSCFALIVCCCLSCLTFTFSLLLSWLSSTMPAFLPDSHSVLHSVCVCVCVCIMLSFPLVYVFISVHLWSICVLPLVLDALHYLVCGFGFLVFFLFVFFLFVFLHSELNSFYCIFESTNINSLTLWDLCHH